MEVGGQDPVSQKWMCAYVYLCKIGALHPVLYCKNIDLNNIKINCYIL